LGEGVSGEEAGRGSQIVVGERLQIGRHQRDFVVLAWNLRDRLRRGGERDHRRGASKGTGVSRTVALGVITALVLMNVEPGRVKTLAQDLLAIDGVTEVYSVAGPYDLVAIARVRRHEQLSDLVTDLIGSRDGVISTETLIAFRAFAKRDLDLVWDIGVD
jgi:DNA-binding Lrp family transcriptional regulator